MWGSKTRTVYMLVLVLCLLAVPAVAVAQDHGHDHGEEGHAHGEGGEGGMDPQMEAMMELAKLSDHHVHMAKLAGNWKTSTKMWQAPGAEPMTGSGTTVNTLVLGGRFLQSAFSGEFSGMPFEGLGTEGYDNGKGKHIGTWMDNMGTMMMTFEGSCSDDHKTLTMVSDFDMGGMALKMRTVTTMKDANSYTMEGWVGPSEDQMMKSMEIIYTRQ